MHVPEFFFGIWKFGTKHGQTRRFLQLVELYQSTSSTIISTMAEEEIYGPT